MAKRTVKRAKRPVQAAPAKAPSWFTAPRLIGILAIVIAVITLLGTLSLAAIAFILAGLALILAPRRHAAAVFDAFTGSFQRWPVILASALYDALYWLVLFISGKFLGDVLLRFAQGVRDVDTTAQGLAAIETVQANSATLGTVFGGVLGSLIAWVVLGFVLYTGSRWLMWQAITAKRSPFRRWLGANALWWLIWLLPAVFFVIGLQESYIPFGLAVVFIIYSHLSALFHKELMAAPARKSIHHALHYGFGRIHRFIVPAALALIVYTILFQPLRFLPIGRGQVAGYIVLIVLFLGWYRTFINTVIDTIALPERY